MYLHYTSSIACIAIKANNTLLLLGYYSHIAVMINHKRLKGNEKADINNIKESAVLV